MTTQNDFPENDLRASLDRDAAVVTHAHGVAEGARRVVRRRRNRRLVVGAAAAAAVAAAAFAVLPGSFATGRGAVAPAATTTSVTGEPSPTASDTARPTTTGYPTREPSPRPTPYRLADGAMQTSFGIVPIATKDPVHIVRELKDSLFYATAGGWEHLHRVTRDGKDTDLGVAWRKVAFSPDGTRYAYWEPIVVGSSQQTLIMRRTLDDKEIARTVVALKDSPPLLWSSKGLFLLDTGGDAAGYAGLTSVMRADPDTLAMTPMPTPTPTVPTISIPNSGDVVFLIDHPTPATTRVRRWAPGGPADVMAGEHTFSAAEMPVNQMDIPMPFQVTPDASKLVTLDAVYDTKTFARIGQLAPEATRDRLLSRARVTNNEYAYVTVPPKALDPAATEVIDVVLACRLTGDRDCMIDPRGLLD